MPSAFPRDLLTFRRLHMTWLAILHRCGYFDLGRSLGWIEQVLSASPNRCQIRSESELGTLRAGINAKDLYIQPLEK